MLVAVAAVPVAGHVQLRSGATPVRGGLKDVAQALVQQAARVSASLAPGGPIAVQVDWLVQMGLTDRLQGQLSEKCEESFKKTIVLSSALPEDLSAPQKAEDATQCGSIGGGAVCHSMAMFSENKAAHADRQKSTQITIWDLDTEWDWCLPSDCASGRDLLNIAAFLRTSINDLVQPSTAPNAMQTALRLDCLAGGGGIAEVGVDGRVRSGAAVLGGSPVWMALTSLLLAISLAQMN